MKEIKIFYLETCPYCQKAKTAYAELLEEKPAYGEIRAEWIEESVHPDIADRYDYYRVPTIFWGDKKLYEAFLLQDYAAIKQSVREALDEVLGA